jgi:hypothetical protein
MPVTGLLIDPGTVMADCNCFPAVVFGWRHKTDAATQALASPTLENGLRG